MTTKLLCWFHRDQFDWDCPGCRVIRGQERIAAGLCVEAEGQCITHGVKADEAHWFAVQPAVSKHGIANND